MRGQNQSHTRLESGVRIRLSSAESVILVITLAQGFCSQHILRTPEHAQIARHDSLTEARTSRSPHGMVLTTPSLRC